MAGRSQRFFPGFPAWGQEFSAVFFVHVPPVIWQGSNRTVPKKCCLGYQPSWKSWFLYESSSELDLVGHYSGSGTGLGMGAFNLSLLFESSGHGSHCGQCTSEADLYEEKYG